MQQNNLSNINMHRHFLLAVFCACVSIELGLVILDLVVNWNKGSGSRAIRRMFNITREDGLASLFAVIQTLVVAVILWIIVWLHRRLGSNPATIIGWGCLALFFTFIGIDDGALIHERIGTAFSKSRGDEELVSYGWQIIVAPFFVVCGLLLFVFLWKQGAHGVRRDWMFLAFACLGTAVGIDFVEGMDNGHQFLEQWFGWRQKTVRHFAKSLEEFLEMLGFTIFLVTFLRYLFFQLLCVEITIIRGTLSVRQSL